MKNYFLASLFIFSWWFIAFFPTHSHIQNTFTIEKTKQCLPCPSPLSKIDREELKSALSGNVALMTRLITEWDLDAKLLQSRGIKEIKRLPEETLLASQVIGRELVHQKNKIIQCKWLPQTYLAATYLLALADKESIVALPPGFRNQTSLFHSNLFDSIPLDFNARTLEKIHIQSPNLCFVSNFSNPLFVKTLEKQGINTANLNPVNTLQELPLQIKQMGHLIDRPLQSELLSTFLAASMMAIENRLLALCSDKKQKIMLVNFYNRFSIPGPHTLSGQLLTRLNANPLFLEGQDLYSTPISIEKLLELNPDILLISTPSASTPQSLFKLHPELKSLKKIVCIDDTVQQSPTQFLILAYYDMAQSL